MLTKLITPKLIISATVAGCLVAAAGVGFIGYQSYAKVQDEARVTLESANQSVAAALDDYEFRVAVLQTELANAQATLDGSAGKTLDETARAELEESIADATNAFEQAERAAADLTERVREVNASFDEQLLWPPNALDSAESLFEATEAISSDVVEATEDVMTDTQAVVAAQAAWQAEQDRIAAEAAAKAAAEAAARRAIRSGGTSNPSSGSTTPNVIAAPPAPAAPTPSTAGAWSAATFLGSYLSPGEYILDWNPSLCSPGYICGTTLFASPPIVTLFGSATAPANYDFAGGRYVLVHEAAHVKQYWYYAVGPGDYNALLAVVPPPPANWTRPAEYWPLEFMADCSTLLKIGWAPTYANSTCDANQLAEAAKIW